MFGLAHSGIPAYLFQVSWKLVELVARHMISNTPEELRSPSIPLYSNKRTKAKSEKTTDEHTVSETERELVCSSSLPVRLSTQKRCRMSEISV